MKKQNGFTLIELMIVVAIIAVLAGIALPMYRTYQGRAAETACLSEMKSYASLAIASMATENATVWPAPVKACSAADDITASTTTVLGTPKQPGTKQASCDVATGNCHLLP
ncbi:prepilin-type N-terminal cleavage/methylation domain-containing protein [Lysobacter sp. HDW10]|uniref:pilin n=1 Tax=Lysobacter sp. HDW10 TaxID=2714936 RepID=UPI0014074830|nr:prepilin-type N-terminal cleavage/methylation domain-containing protein [Lysobacter sp. HDW10]QIK80337.1 prepilin-type N-terminal cleavage/methylation domain-containing protein [Lysobacter sp. HDW10]